MLLLSPWATRLRRVLRAMSGAVDPGEDGALPTRSTPESVSRVVLTLDDLLWSTTSEDAEGRLTLGLLECSPGSIGVLVDDNGESLGLRLSRAEAQDLHRSLVTWLAGTARTVTS